MALQSSVEFKGLTRLMFFLDGRSRRMQPQIGWMTRSLMDTHHDRYVENLEGSVPSTTARPLPVGMVTGELRASARKRQLNQFSYKIWNDAGHAGFIEDGTQYMTPRRPLGDATDQIDKIVPGEMDKVVTKVWET
jgi:hypothetical protein